MAKFVNATLIVENEENESTTQVPVHVNADAISMVQASDEGGSLVTFAGVDDIYEFTDAPTLFTGGVA